MTPEERAKEALVPLINPEPHPLQVDWSDAHSMDLGTLFRRVEAAIEAARSEALEEAAKMMDAKSDSLTDFYVKTKDTQYLVRATDCRDAANDFRDLQTKGE